MIVNLTPHDIVVLAENGRDVLTTLKPDGTVARVAVTREPAGTVDGLPVYRTTYGAVTGLPAPTPGVCWLVSLLVRQAAPERADLLTPGELVRNTAGQPVGCKGLTA